MPADNWPTEGALGLSVSHHGTSIHAVPGQVITFGRSVSATIKLDSRRSDPVLHRLVGSFRFAGGRWELNNEGAARSLRVEMIGGLSATLDPGSHPLPLPWGARGTVSVATTHTYCLTFRTAGVESDVQAPDLDDVEGSTSDLRESLGLSKDEERMLIALCEIRLLDPTIPAWIVPGYPQLSDRLGGITKKRVEDLIDGLARKFAAYVPGLTGEGGTHQQFRRQMLVNFAIVTKCVARQDLRLLLPKV